MTHCILTIYTVNVSILNDSQTSTTAVHAFICITYCMRTCGYGIRMLAL